MAQQGLSALQKGYADLPDGQVHYRHRPGSGTPVVFLHQTASSGAMWEKVMAHWTAPHPLYALDTPGFGGSFDPSVPPSMADYALWIGEAIDTLGLGPVHLVGHHTGSGIALELAATRSVIAASLAMVGPSVLSADERAAFAAKLGAPFRPVRSGAYLLKNWEYLRVGGADEDVDLLHREMADQLRAWSTRPHAYAAAWGQDQGVLITQVACPAIAIAAHDDLLFPSLARVAELRSDIDTVTLSAGANFEPDLVPDELTAILLRHIARLKPKALRRV